MAEHPMFTMVVALRSRGEAGPVEEAPLDLVVHNIEGDDYLAIRTGGVLVLLNEYEARAFGVAVEGLSEHATSLRSARDHASGTGSETR